MFGLMRRLWQPSFAPNTRNEDTLTARPLRPLWRLSSELRPLE